MATSISTMSIALTAKTGMFIKKMKASKRHVLSFGKSVAAAGMRVTKYGAAMTAVAAGALTVMVNKHRQLIDNLAKTADKLGLTTEALAGLQLAGELTGVAARTMDMALQRMTRRLAEAAQGGGEAKAAIEELGLNAQELARIAPDKALMKISEAMKAVESQSDKVRLAFKFFDSEGVALVNTLSLGEEGFRKTMEEAVKFGTALSRVDASKVEAANDALTRVKEVFAGLAKQFTVAVAPAIEAVANKFTNWATEGEGASARVTDAVEGVALAFGALGDMWDTARFKWLKFEETLLKGLHVGLDALIPAMTVIDEFNKIGLKQYGLGSVVPKLSEALDWDKLTDNLLAKSLEAAEASRKVVIAPTSDKIKNLFDEIRADAQRRALAATAKPSPFVGPPAELAGPLPGAAGPQIFIPEKVAGKQASARRRAMRGIQPGGGPKAGAGTGDDGQGGGGFFGDTADAFAESFKRKVEDPLKKLAEAMGGVDAKAGLGGTMNKLEGTLKASGMHGPIFGGQKLVESQKQAFGAQDAFAAAGRKVPGGKGQEVHDEQLEMTNLILASIETNTAGGARVG